jgi:hypothetical protein
VNVYKNSVTIQLPKPNNSALDNIALRTALAYTALIYPISLSSQQSHKTRPYALIFEVERKNKGIRARLGTLLATKGNVINKG